MEIKKLKLFAVLGFTFMLFTIIGTQTHEYGHYIAATYLGMKPSLHYQSVNFGEDDNSMELNGIFMQFENEILSSKDFPLRKRYDFLVNISSKKDFYSRLWGPLQTMLTGTIGFLFILFYRKQFLQNESLERWQWLLVFLSLFWLREVFNTFLAFILYIIKDQKVFYGDEFILSNDLHFHHFTIPIITAIIGFIICSIVTFKFVPINQQKIFIAAGLVGGVMGYVLWMYLLGPKVLP